jgi:Nif-specific regulatory protein
LSNRTARGVEALFRISNTLQSAQSIEVLERHLLDILFEAIPAERGAILLGAGLAFGAHRHQGESVVRVPQEIVEQVEKGHTGVLADSGPRSMLGAPLTCFERAMGLLFLEGDGKAAFDDEHLELATAVGAIAGLAIYNLERMESLRTENARLQAESHIEHDIAGTSDAITRVHRFISQVAATDSTVLIQGESGTGKELVARALHRNSSRAEKPFVAINCAALTENLLEDELFGHERGAFTGAISLKKGKFEVAEGGTLFLDEIGELALGLQAKLLRVLQQREFERVGGVRPLKANVRIVAATNRDLEAAARQNSFRQDLYFRLNVVGVRVPALRERRDDIPLLASYFARKFGPKCKRRVSGLSQAAEVALKRYDWPGNVRELENAIERAVVLGVTELILPDDLPEAVLESSLADRGTTSALGDFQSSVMETKRKAVKDALDRAGGVYTEAAKLLGVHPNYLHRLVKNLGLR